MALTSSSTYTNAVAQYNDNLRYWESTTKAANLLEAILWLEGNRPTSMNATGSSLKFEDLPKLRERVEASLAAQNGGNRARFVRGRALR